MILSILHSINKSCWCIYAETTGQILVTHGQFYPSWKYIAGQWKFFTYHIPISVVWIVTRLNRSTIQGRELPYASPNFCVHTDLSLLYVCSNCPITPTCEKCMCKRHTSFWCLQLERTIQLYRLNCTGFKTCIGKKEGICIYRSNYIYLCMFWKWYSFEQNRVANHIKRVIIQDYILISHWDWPLNEKKLCYTCRWRAFTSVLIILSIFILILIFWFNVHISDDDTSYLSLLL